MDTGGVLLFIVKHTKRSKNKKIYKWEAHNQTGLSVQIAALSAFSLVGDGQIFI